MKTPKAKPERKKSAPDYIDWTEFNQILSERGEVPHPQDDSRDDSGEDEQAEVELGEDFPEERRASRSKKVVRGDVPHAARDEDNLYEDKTEGVTAEPSPRPAPRLDRESERDTH